MKKELKYPTLVVNKLLVENFLHNLDTTHDSHNWFFTSSRPYTQPPRDNNTKQQCAHLLKIVEQELSNFTPLNQTVLDQLFPKWQTETLYLNIIVGFPAPYDVVTEADKAGKIHVMMDIFQLSQYNIPDHTITDILRNIITHEIVHLLIAKRHPNILKESQNYNERLDKIVFNEGFAHLLSYNSCELEETDWNSNDLQELYRTSKTKLSLASAEKITEKQEIFLQQADTGTYKEKFGAMSAMLYLAHVWCRQGVAGLNYEMNIGFTNITKRILETS